MGHTENEIKVKEPKLNKKVKKLRLIAEIQKLGEEAYYAEYRLPAAIREFLALNPTKKERQEVQDEIDTYNV